MHVPQAVLDTPCLKYRFSDQSKLKNNPTEEIILKQLFIPNFLILRQYIIGMSECMGFIPENTIHYSQIHIKFISQDY